MKMALVIKVWVKGGEDTRRPDYYIKIDDSEYKTLLRDLVASFEKIAHTLERGNVPVRV